MISIVFAALLAQCPDGSPPPCARPAPSRPAAATMDPNRIAVLPFRVTTADSLLGEGLAELVATEFTGESGPRAVNMGTVLRAWRGAGGGLRAPLSQDGAARLAREMGAGFYVEGSVVGLGPRLTINAAVVPVQGGTARRAAPVAGPADSLDVLVSRLTSTLLAAAGSERGAERARLTDSPAAMRTYIEGLALWRSGRTEAAALAFERAFSQDSMFARAAFMRWLAGGWIAQAPGNWAGATWRLRQRLSNADQLLLIGQLGENYPTPRSLASRFEGRERAAERLPESAEAQYFFADYLYHYGAGLNVADAMPRARAAFERSAALDSQGTVMQHLIEVAMLTGDTALALRAWVAFDRIAGNAWDWGMAVAAMRGDQAMLATQRRRAGPINHLPVNYTLAEGRIPPAAAEEILALTDRHLTGSLARFTGAMRAAWAASSGRHDAMMRMAATETELRPDVMMSWLALAGDTDSAAGAAAFARWRPTVRGTDVAPHQACLIAFYDLRSRAPATDSVVMSRTGARCGAVLKAVRAVQVRAPEAMNLLMIADSISRHTLGLQAELYPGYDRMALALAWEAHGDTRRALDAIRVRPYGGNTPIVEAARLREEGRLALAAADTAGARVAWNNYLIVRSDPDRALVPKRDSVRAALTTIR